MSKTILVYPPFCTPASPPYSITNIYAFLKNNLQGEHEINVLDLNIEFHKQKFSDYRQYCKSLNHRYDYKEYDTKTKEYMTQTKFVYSDNNKMILNNETPDLFDELLKTITDTDPDIVAFSIVYSSQVFYAYALIKELKRLGIRTIVGGPAVNGKLIQGADQHLKNELELLNYILGNEQSHDNLNFKTLLDFNIYSLEDYFTPEPVLPIRTTSSCYYKRCTFCTHHCNTVYMEYSLDNIRESLRKSGTKRVFIVDDMIHKKRLLQIADIMGELKISWMCQLKPTADLDRETLTILKESGLKMIIWGVESASDRILTLMQKGTNIRDVRKVLEESNDMGIRNSVYIMFGFPSESEQEFIKTIEFLKDNQRIIDLIATSIFGLQKGSIIYDNPKFYGITKIIKEQRTILGPKITYKVGHGLTTEQASRLRKNYKKTLDSLSKYPRSMNFFREHLLCLS